MFKKTFSVIKFVMIGFGKRERREESSHDRMRLRFWLCAGARQISRTRAMTAKHQRFGKTFGGVVCEREEEEGL
jgi:hypothetical protein